jgi:hypothetical protein
MNWRQILSGFAIAALAGAAQTAGPLFPQQPGQPIQWRPIGQAAGLGAILGALAHISSLSTAAQPTAVTKS